MTPESSLETARARLNAGYPALWHSMIADFADSSADRVWLTGPANYLFCAAGIRWAVDPAFKHPDVINLINAAHGRPLERLSFCLHTHGHNDHVHTPTLQALAPLPITWVAPHFMRDKLAASGVPLHRLLLVEPGDVIQLCGLTLHAFEGRHYDAGTRLGVDSLWYLIEAGGRRIFLPGDVRDYDTAHLPPLGRVHDLFAHVWLGRKNALNPNPEPFLSQLAAFIARIAPDRLFLTHLYELRRPPDSLWTAAHAALVSRALRPLAPDTQIVIPRIAEQEPL